jgi:hypothetical protein
LKKKVVRPDKAFLNKEVFMIKESIQITVKLIEDIQKVDPIAYQDEKIDLDDLVQHMKIVMVNLDKSKKD